HFARSIRVNRRPSGLAIGGRKCGVAGWTISPLSSCQLPRPSTRVSIGFQGTVTTVGDFPPRQSSTSRCNFLYSANAPLPGLALNKYVSLTGLVYFRNRFRNPSVNSLPAPDFNGSWPANGETEMRAHPTALFPSCTVSASPFVALIGSSSK